MHGLHALCFLPRNIGQASSKEEQVWPRGSTDPTLYPRAQGFSSPNLALDTCNDREVKGAGPLGKRGRRGGRLGQRKAVTL